MKKFITGLTLVSTLAPVALAVSCGTSKVETLNLGKHELLLKRETQDAKDRVHLILENIRKQDIKTLPSNINTYFHSHLVSGGFGEERHYYTGSSSMLSTEHNSNFHAGIDILLPTNNEIVSPVNGEVIAAFWKDSPALFYGIGGVAIVRSEISKMNIDDNLKEFIYVKTSHTRPEVMKLPKMLFTHNGVYKAPSETRLFSTTEAEYKTYIDSLSTSERSKKIDEAKYVYLTFMHLSKESLNIFSKNKVEVNADNPSKHVIYNKDIDEEHPYIVKRGQLIGRVGTMADNGGWAPHVHLEAHSALLSFGKKISRYKFSSLPLETDHSYSLKISHLYSNAKPVGTYISSSLTSGRETWNNYAEGRGVIDPNNIYKLYDEKTKVVKFKF